MYLGMSGKNASIEHSDEIIITVSLPGVKLKDIELDVTSNAIDLRCPTFKLRLPLPVTIRDKDGSAKFDKDECKLIITAPIIPEWPF